MNLSKVFYSVSRNKLIKELNTMGVKGQQKQKLFKLYLTNWNQYVKISQMYNFIARFQLRVQTITLGIPQGSNLGPFFVLTVCYVRVISDCLSYPVFV